MRRALETIRFSFASRIYLGPTTFSNASAFGAHRFKKKLLHTAISNASTFGVAFHRAAGEEVQLLQHARDRQPNRDHHGHARRRHAGAGRHRNSSTARPRTSSGGTRGSSATLKFDLGSAKVVKQARWKQSNSSTHGTFKWQGSNDDSTYTDIGGTFTLGGATVQIHTTLIDNETAYRYYKLRPDRRHHQQQPVPQEVEFFIEGATKDQPDASYRYPCGGGSDVGGDVSGVGGSGVDRSSLITVTAGYTVASAGQNAQNWVDGAVGNNTTDCGLTSLRPDRDHHHVRLPRLGQEAADRRPLDQSQQFGTGQGT